MKRFITKVLFFLAIGLLIPLTIYFIISINHKFLPNNMYYCDEFNKAFKNGNYDIIAIGNSKLLSSLDGEILEKELNLSTAILGYSSSDMSISKLTLISYLDICKTKPKTVILEVSWFSFNNKRTGFHKIDGDLFITDPKLFRYFFHYYPKSFNDVRNKIKKQVMRLLIKSTYIDYSSRHKEKDKFSKTYSFNIDNFLKIFPNKKAGINPFLLNDFYDIVETCINNNIKLILYTAPEDEEYTRLQKDRNKVYKIFYDMSEKSSIIYLNYTLGGELYNKNYENWLSNSHHLNEKELFTRDLTKDIKVRTHNKGYTQ